MRYRVVILDRTLEGVNQHLDYIAEQCQEPLAAARWWVKAMCRIQTLESMPRRCPLAPENAHSENEIRMMIVDKCLFLFHVDDDNRSVFVVGFRHGCQDLP